MVRKFDLIFMCLDSGQYSRGLLNLRNLIVFLDSQIKHKLEPQVTQIDNIIYSAGQIGGMNRGMRMRSQKNRINEESSRVLLPMLDIVMDAIHEAGYFGWEKSGWTNLAGNKKSGMTDREGIPALAKQGVL